VKSLGDGMMATFDGPARAIRCAGAVAGSGIGFTERGEHELKGVPDRWRLFTVDR